MPGIPENLLELPSDRAARTLALAFLDEVSAARQRLQDPQDTEALHDCRVGLRRLRSSLRAYREPLAGAVPKKIRARLREVAGSTNAGRDAEVQLDWLSAHRDDLKARERGGHRWLVERLEDRKREGYAQALEKMGGELEQIEAQLRRRLSALEPSAQETAFACFAGELVQRHATELRARLAEVRSSADELEAHAARIAAKRLRYLLEPFAAHLERSKATVKRLKALQDVLGKLHDAQLLATEVGTSLELAAAAKARRLHTIALQDGAAEARLRAELRRDERPGLLALARLLKSQREQLFETVRTEWLEARAEGFLQEVEALALDMASRGRPDREIERKFLLRGLPDAARNAPYVEIEQGWLPGERLLERLRRTRTPAGERFHRTVKLGQGIERIEIEEETERRLFEKLWPLTETQRVCKRRYKIPDSGLTWEIDEFLDRDLVLAEVELPSRDVQVVPPEWIRPWLVREVTGEAEYVNANLSRVQSPRATDDSACVMVPVRDSESAGSQ